LNVIKTGMELITGQDFFNPDQSVSRWDALSNFGGALASTAVAVFLPFALGSALAPGAAVASGGFERTVGAEATTGLEATAALSRSSMGSLSGLESGGSFGGVESELAASQQNLGFIPEGKTVAADQFGQRTLSGWTDTPGFLPSNQQVGSVLAKADQIGFQFQTHVFDQGTAGRYFASHAEPQLSLDSNIFAVSRNMCISCRSFMSARSVAEGTTFVVQDPTRIWTFSPSFTSWF
jgi:hypothetical protein